MFQSTRGVSSAVMSSPDLQCLIEENMHYYTSVLPDLAWLRNNKTRLTVDSARMTRLDPRAYLDLACLENCLGGPTGCCLLLSPAVATASASVGRACN